VGHLRIRGELLKLGVDVSATTIATVLRQGGLGPAPRRIGPTWTQFLRLQAYGLLSPGAPSEEGERLEELVVVPRQERLVPLGEWPAIAGAPPHAQSVPTGQPSSTVDALPPASGLVPPRAGTRKSDGPRDRRLNLSANSLRAAPGRSLAHPRADHVDRGGLRDQMTDQRPTLAGENDQESESPAPDLGPRSSLFTPQQAGQLNYIMLAR